MLSLSEIGVAFLSDGLLHMDFCRQRHDASLLALLWSLEEENDHVYA